MTGRQIIMQLRGEIRNLNGFDEIFSTDEEF